MNEQINDVLSKVGPTVLEAVARAMLDDATAVLDGEPLFEEIKTSHNDLRTLGIVKVSSNATSVGEKKRWSTVAKILDPTMIDKDNRGDVTLDNEQTIYELGLFSEADVPMRAAKCYLKQLIEGRYRIVWLEDLSHAAQPPWALEHFVAAANHLGQFAGYHMANQTQMPFTIQRDWYLERIPAERAIADAQSLLREQKSDRAKAAYRDVSVESAIELAELIGRVHTAGQRAPHCLSFGDSHSRNMFPLGHSTVAVDWGFTGSEPVGADVRVLVGSSLTYSMDEARMVATHERKICNA